MDLKFVIMSMVFLLWTTRYLISAGGVCVTKIKDGKFLSEGDCENSKASSVLMDLERKLKAREHIYQEDCSGVTPNLAKVRNSTGGVFQIYPPSYSGGIEVFCDLTTDGRGWTVFQRRMDGSVDFLRNFQDYVDGFGSPDKEYWMGLEKIHRLTSDGNYELRIDLEDWEGSRRYAKYSTFSVAGASDKYRLRIGGYTGNSGDSLANLDNQFFSTIDRDNDEAPGEPSCAVQFKGAWWFKLCFLAHLNGVYHQGSAVAEAQGIIWSGWKGWYYSLKFAEMKFRRKN